MKRKISFWCLPVVLFTAFGINSCKKTDQSNVPNLLTTRQWELASVLVYNYVGDSQVGTADTLNADCDTTQVFKFFKDGSCSYTNYSCAEPVARGTYSLSDTKLVLHADIAFADTALAGGARPFANAQIYTLGDFSMVLQTGDTQPYYTSTQPRTIYRWGFIRQSEVTTR
ncbi:hypothetical protein [Mucilaginibacter pedocola]|uniref:Lipocalin-like domain-containing protein n=1 Tax=Mucilaginibacter pedocola TaxID=1792845 RepID=A0A1S9PB21_9SPHI|nr:hypothetical protein [Mucilaginibacter pedocola]OOQ58155.1 hypothetical protein BC343_10920 [Mucilaginibacter pedocola]